MSLSRLDIVHVRNLASIRLDLHPRFNLFIGDNGSGKTSLLESIYLLTHGHSFRTREHAALIQHDKASLTVFGKTLQNETISIQKSIAASTKALINGLPCQSSSELARLIPTQYFYQDIFQIIDAGPAVRRHLLDWGVFHVEQSYHAIWKQYRQVLKQRNALLRQKAPLNQFTPWNQQLAELATALHTIREAYCQQWFPIIHEYMQVLTTMACSIDYEKGWDKKKTGTPLIDILKKQLDSDLMRQYTQSGPHQADIIIQTLLQTKAKQTLSRGQQKMLLIALKMAQARLLKKSCIYLFDDITAELDQLHLKKLLQCIKQGAGQYFLTSVDTAFLSAFAESEDAKIFRIEKGHIFEVTSTCET